MGMVIDVSESKTLVCRGLMAFLAVGLLAISVFAGSAFASGKDDELNAQPSSSVAAEAEVSTAEPAPAAPSASAEPGFEAPEVVEAPSKANTWQSIGGKHYYYDANEKKLAPGWHRWGDGTWSYFNADGSAAIGWKKLAGTWYYLNPATLRAAKWETVIDGKSYYFDGSNAMRTGWVKRAGGVWSYYNADGSAAKGWKKLAGTWYYLDPSTLAAAKWETVIDDKSYYFDGSNAMRTGWVKRAGGVWSYYNADGSAAKGWKKIAGTWYYLDPSTLAAAKWETVIGGKSYYFDGSNAMRTGWVKRAGGVWSYYNADGSAARGWKRVGGAWYYLDPETYQAVKGERKLDGKWYYFDGSNAMVTGWHKWGNAKQWSYYYADGSRASGTKKIGTQTFVFDENGRTTTEPILLPAHQEAMNKKAQQFESDTSWLILVDRDSRHVGIYRGEQGNWRCVKYWLCCVGKPSTPTITGSYKVSGKGLSFGNGYTCWYYTQIKGNYLFHSVSYLPGSKTQLLDGRLGIANSHGCVRLDINNAKWMYDNVPYNTKIFIY